MQSGDISYWVRPEYSSKENREVDEPNPDSADTIAWQSTELIRYRQFRTRT
jgi:hypothetical protein